MGGEWFYLEVVTNKGTTMNIAFDAAVKEYQHEYGHGGYSGTIAEKRYGFRPIKLPAGRDPEEYALSLCEDRDKRIDDKWGPAGGFDLGDGRFAFCGWASS